MRKIKKKTIIIVIIFIFFVILFFPKRNSQQYRDIYNKPSAESYQCSCMGIEVRFEGVSVWIHTKRPTIINLPIQNKGYCFGVPINCQTYQALP